MKKLLLLTLLFPLLFSCNNNSSTGNNGDADSIKSDTTKIINGIIGEGTSMHSLELIADNDSVYILYDESIVVGGAVVGDEVSVLCDYSEEGLTALKIINLTALRHLWAITGTQGKQHLELDKKGVAISYGMDNYYSRWNVDDVEHLVLVSDESTDTFDIQLLTDDSLVISNEKSVLRMIKEN